MGNQANKRNVYLKMKSLPEARQLVQEHFAHCSVEDTETIAVTDAVGRILAVPVHAEMSSPHFHAAAMDGYAVKAERTFGASEIHPIELMVGKDAIPVNTGHVLPPDTDAVIMIEHIQLVDHDRVSLEKPAFPWQHVRKIGEDIVATELLFARNHRVTPYCIGALLTAGVFEVTVRTRPRVLIIPTGGELVKWQDAVPGELQPGQILETNSYMLEKLVASCGGVCTRHEPVVDDVESIHQAVSAAFSEGFSIVLILGGSSAGSEDFSRRAVEHIGELVLHGVTIMPGKPVVVGDVDRKPVFGVPGYPVSAIIAFEQFVRPLLLSMQGQVETERSAVVVEPTRKIASKLGLEEFVRVKIGEVDGRLVATPLPRGAGLITTMTEADGIIRVADNLEGLNEGQPAEAELLKPLSSVSDTIVVVGSHDNTLDVLADQLKAVNGRYAISSSHVGSMGGLMAIKKGLCHLAGSHLLDTSDGSYNVSYLKRYLPEVAVKLVHLVEREQGLIIPKGNPKAIRGLEDLSRTDVSFINRQGGSGTRILLDDKLQQLGLTPDAINGYDHEEFTHMAIAVAVLSGTADTGLGIYAAARALGLDFIPVVTENYDLVIPKRHFETDKVGVLLEIIRSEAFKERVMALGGYNTGRTGEVIL
jgi:putative molybdopterin biosynthesis protein